MTEYIEAFFMLIGLAATLIELVWLISFLYEKVQDIDNLDRRIIYNIDRHNELENKYYELLVELRKLKEDLGQ